jgi:hypothetical protein
MRKNLDFTKTGFRSREESSRNVSLGRLKANVSGPVFMSTTIDTGMLSMYRLEDG